MATTAFAWLTMFGVAVADGPSNPAGVQSVNGKSGTVTIGPGDLGVGRPPIGAKGDGVADDTAALQAWASSVTSDNALSLPSGTYAFTSPIVFPLADRVTITGTGVLRYIGAPTTATLVSLGSSVNTSSVAAPDGCSIRNWNVGPIQIRSLTTMTAGDAFLVKDACASTFAVNAGKDLNGDGRLWNALHFAGGNTVRYTGEGASAQNDALLVHGDQTVQFTDFWWDRGLFLGSTVGIHIAGNVGGFEGISGDVLLNKTNVKIDRSAINIANSQVFLGPNVAIDVTNGAPNRGLYVTDPGGDNSYLTISGTWFASASDSCIFMDAGTTWKVAMTGGVIGNCQGSGFYSNSATVTANFVGTHIWGNQNYGINAPSGTITKCGVLFRSNNPGNTFGTIGSSC